ncbi:MAG: hypothetical protein J7K61_06430 [Thermoplasmata archaeon]|nr:hypothetical protein [Thermoplasmata archaeon]
MDVRKKVLLVGMAIVVLSAAIATQYARVSIAYSYGVSASDGAIRFIARDVAPDGNYVLQNNGNSMELHLGTFTPGTNKTYTAAFGIVNEENFNVYLYNVTVTGSGTGNMKIWLHKNPNITASNDPTAVLVWDGDYTSFSNITFHAGNNDATDASSDAGTINTPLDSGVRYNTTSPAATDNNDYWWVQISIDIPSGTGDASYSGNIYFSFTSVQ